MNEFSMNLPDVMTGQHLGLGIYSHRSKGFQALINGIGAAKTKHEEDKIIRKELLSLKEYVTSSKLSAKQIRELLIRLIYCEMLGHDASFGYINAIKYAEQSKLLEKKTGYLAASVFLNKNHTLVCLLINTIQKDLASTNVVAKGTVLNVICNLVDAEKIPPLLPFIVAALKDTRVEIRKKALITLRHVHQLSEDLIVNIDEQLRSAISDRDPIVVSAALQFLHRLIKKNPSKYRSYLKVFIQVLTQVVEGKLSEYNFHGVQAPWIQIKLLNIFALLGHQNKSCSENMSATLINMMRALPTDCNIGCAVLFECIRTATTIYPLKPLLDLAAKKTTLFLTSNSSNLKCLGITAMTSLVEVNTSYAGDEKLQQVIIKCLDDDDKTIGKKILELLYKITNSENVCVICEKLLDYIRASTEQIIKSDVARNLAQLANQYAPNITWYVDTINDVILAADSFVQPDVIHSLIKVVAAGESEDQRIIASRYLDLIKKTTLNDSLIQVACWVLGEYGNIIQDDNSLEMVFSHLAALLDRKFEDTTTYGWIMSALAKLTQHMGVYSPIANRIMDRYRTGFPAELRQRCHEINSLATDMSLMNSVLPLAATEADIKVCSSLSFLDNYVANALTAGARPYQPHLSNFEEATEPRKAPQELRFQPYEDPFRPKSLVERKSCKNLKDDEPSFVKPSPQNPVSADEEESVKSPKKSTSKPTSPLVWGPSGYTGNKIKKAAEGPEKCVQSSSGHSSTEDRGNQSQLCDEITSSFQETKNSERIPLLTSVDKSSKVALFAGIKPKTKVDTPRKVKTDTYNDNSKMKVAVSSEESSSIASEVISMDHRSLNNVDLAERKVESMISAVDLTDFNEADLEKTEGKSEEDTTTITYEADLLLDTTEKHSAQIEKPLQTVVNLGPSTSSLLEENRQILNERNVAADILDVGVEGAETGNSVKYDSSKKTALSYEENSQVHADNNVVGSLLDAGIGTDETGSLFKQDSWDKTASHVEENKQIQCEKNAVESMLDADIAISETDDFIKQHSPSAFSDSLSRKDQCKRELCIDSNVRLLMCVVAQPAELIMVMKLTNHNQGRFAIESISLNIEPPSNLIAEASRTEITVEKLSFLETVTKDISLKCQYPATRMTLKGTLRYSLSKNSKVLLFEQELPARHLFRPLPMFTEQFGEKWKSTSCDLRKHVTMTSRRSCEDVVSDITKHIHFETIDIKGSEGIAAASVLSNDICLLHLNVLNADIEMWVKSSSKKLSEMIMKECLSACDELYNG